MKHYTSEMYGELEYSKVMKPVTSEPVDILDFARAPETHYRTHILWNDGGETVSPTPDQAAAGIIAIMPDVYNGQEYYEIPQGDTCPC